MKVTKNTSSADISAALEPLRNVAFPLEVKITHRGSVPRVFPEVSPIRFIAGKSHVVRIRNFDQLTRVVRTAHDLAILNRDAQGTDFELPKPAPAAPSKETGKEPEKAPVEPEKAPAAGKKK
jgi:hypothetical protein